MLNNKSQVINWVMKFLRKWLNAWHLHVQCSCLGQSWASGFLFFSSRFRFMLSLNRHCQNGIYLFFARIGSFASSAVSLSCFERTHTHRALATFNKSFRLSSAHSLSSPSLRPSNAIYEFKHFAIACVTIGGRNERSPSHWRVRAFPNVWNV